MQRRGESLAAFLCLGHGRDWRASRPAGAAVASRSVDSAANDSQSATDGHRRALRVSGVSRAGYLVKSHLWRRCRRGGESARACRKSKAARNHWIVGENAFGACQFHLRPAKGCRTLRVQLRGLENEQNYNRRSLWRDAYACLMRDTAGADCGRAKRRAMHSSRSRKAGHHIEQAITSSNRRRARRVSDWRACRFPVRR